MGEDVTLPAAVLWEDPGKMTGLALLFPHQVIPEPSVNWWCDEGDFMAAGDWVTGLSSSWRERLWIGWERYDINVRMPQKDAHHAIEMIGVTRRAAMRNGCRILTPAAPSQRKIATRKMLASIGWWVPGKDDAQSAAAHMLAWLLREGELPPRERELLSM